MTQAEWFARIKTWVPSWMFDQSTEVEPIFQMMARMMAEHEVERDGMITETFIDTADGSWLDTHGHERDIPRLAGELDPPYAVRVRTQNLVSRVDYPSLKKIIDSLLISGTAAIREDFEGGFYIGRGSYVNRGVVSFPLIKDAFTIVVNRQVHVPYSFVTRGAFAGRSDFIGDANSNLAVFQLIIQAVNDNRAFGALFRIVERLN